MLWQYTRTYRKRTVIVVIAASFGIVEIKKRSTVNTDTIIGMFWSLGMALGIIFISLTPGYPPAISKIITCNLRNIMVLSILFGIAFSLLGLVISYKLHIASGASRIIVAVSSYVIFFLLNKVISIKKG